MGLFGWGRRKETEERLKNGLDYYLKIFSILNKTVYYNLSQVQQNEIDEKRMEYFSPDISNQIAGLFAQIPDGERKRELLLKKKRIEKTLQRSESLWD